MKIFLLRKINKSLLFASVALLSIILLLWTAALPVSYAVSYTFEPVADSYVDSSSSTKNYGTSSQFRVDGSPVVNSYLRFDVNGINGTVTKATLKIYANSNQSVGFDVKGVSDNGWVETKKKGVYTLRPSWVEIFHV